MDLCGTREVTPVSVCILSTKASFKMLNILILEITFLIS